MAANELTVLPLYSAGENSISSLEQPPYFLNGEITMNYGFNTLGLCSHELRLSACKLLAIQLLYKLSSLLSKMSNVPKLTNVWQSISLLL